MHIIAQCAVICDGTTPTLFGQCDVLLIIASDVTLCTDFDVFCDFIAEFVL